MEISTEELRTIREFLKEIKKVSESEDWDECYAQSLTMDGAQIYDEIFNKQPNE